MAKVQIGCTFAGKTPDAVYIAAEAACPKAGWEVWKSRPIAWLLQLRKKGAGGDLQASLACKPGKETQAIVTVSSDTIQEEGIRAEADQILQAIQKEVR